MSIILQDQLVLSPKTKKQVEQNTKDIAELKEEIVGVYHFKGSVDTVADLDNITDQKAGDVWNVRETGENYAWVEPEESGEEGYWDNLGSGMIKVDGSYLRSLTPEQEIILANTGTYEGKTLTKDEVFLSTIGKFIDCKITSKSGGTERLPQTFTSLYWSMCFYFKGRYYFRCSNAANSSAGFYRLYSSPEGKNWTVETFDITGRVFQSDDVTIIFNDENNLEKTCFRLYEDENGNIIQDNITATFESPYILSGGIDNVCGYVNDTPVWLYYNTNYSNNKYYYSDDEGSTWRILTYPEKGSTNTIKILWLDDKFVLFSGTSVYHSVDGETWEYKGLTDIPADVSNARSAKDLIFILNGSTVYKSSDGGLTFNTCISNFANDRVEYFYCKQAETYVIWNPLKYCLSKDGITWSDIYVAYGVNNNYMVCNGPDKVIWMQPYGNYPRVAVYIDYIGMSYKAILKQLSYNKTEIDNLINDNLQPVYNPDTETITI